MHTPLDAEAEAFFAGFTPLVSQKSGRGGFRPGAGRKPRDKDGVPVDEHGNELSAFKRKELAQAIKEEHLARQAAVKANLEEGLVVDREMVRSAAARAFAQCSQALDAIGDSLERDGIPIDVCERVMLLVNAAKEQLALDLERTHVSSAD